MKHRTYQLDTRKLSPMARHPHLIKPRSGKTMPVKAESPPQPIKVEPVKVESVLTAAQADFIARFKIACNAPIGSAELRSLVYGV